MEYSTWIQKVASFHRRFDHPIEPKPVVPEEKRGNLRVALLEEEVAELKSAVHEKNLVEIADALCDIQYVLCGAILEFGLQDKFDALFEEVQRSNMSKACRSEEEAIATVNYFREKKRIECYVVKQRDDQWIVYRKKDNKTIKSINYSPADIASVLRTNTGES